MKSLVWVGRRDETHLEELTEIWIDATFNKEHEFHHVKILNEVWGSCHSLEISSEIEIFVIGDCHHAMCVRWTINYSNFTINIVSNAQNEFAHKFVDLDRLTILWLFLLKIVVRDISSWDRSKTIVVTVFVVVGYFLTFSFQMIVTNVISQHEFINSSHHQSFVSHLNKVCVSRCSSLRLEFIFMRKHISFPICEDDDAMRVNSEYKKDEEEWNYFADEAKREENSEHKFKIWTKISV